MAPTVTLLKRCGASSESSIYTIGELQEKKEFYDDDLEKAATDLYDATNAFREKWNVAFGEKASDGEEFAAFDTAVSDLYAHGLSLQIK